MPAETTADPWVQMSNQMYHASAGLGAGEFVTSSMVKCFAQSPRLFQNRYVKKIAPMHQTDAMKQGSMFHARMAGTFQDEFCATPVCPHERAGKPLKSGKKYEEWLATVDLGGREPYTPQEDAIVTGLVHAIRQHDEIKHLADAQGVVEQVLRCEIGGRPCQVKLDKWMDHDPIQNDSTPIIIDWKVTQSLARFKWQVRDLHYGLQAGFYAAIHRRVFGTIPRFYFAVVERYDPNAAALFYLPPGVMSSQMEEAVCKLAEMENCDAAGVYPTGWEGVQPLLIGVE